jgi:hypothetical protein
MRGAIESAEEAYDMLTSPAVTASFAEMARLGGSGDLAGFTAYRDELTFTVPSIVVLRLNALGWVDPEQASAVERDPFFQDAEVRPNLALDAHSHLHSPGLSQPVPSKEDIDRSVAVGLINPGHVSAILATEGPTAPADILLYRRFDGTRTPAYRGVSEGAPREDVLDAMQASGFGFTDLTFHPGGRSYDNLGLQLLRLFPSN